MILAIFTRVYIKFGYSLQYNLTKQLYWKYLKSTYDFHINTNTSTLIANINIEVTNLIKGYFFSAIQLFTEVFVIIGIMIVLLFLQFKLTLVIAIYFSLIVFPYLIFLRKKNREWGIKDNIMKMSKLKICSLVLAV